MSARRCTEHRRFPRPRPGPPRAGRLGSGAGRPVRRPVRLDTRALPYAAKRRLGCYRRRARRPEPGGPRPDAPAARRRLPSILGRSRAAGHSADRRQHRSRPARGPRARQRRGARLGDEPAADPPARRVAAGASGRVRGHSHGNGRGDRERDAGGLHRRRRLGRIHRQRTRRGRHAAAPRRRPRGPRP